MGPLVGAYFLLIRRARNYDKWHRFLEKLLDEEYPGAAMIMASFLDMTLELSKSLAHPQKKEKNPVSEALDIMSSPSSTS